MRGLGHQCNCHRTFAKTVLRMRALFQSELLSGSCLLLLFLLLSLSFFLFSSSSFEVYSYTFNPLELLLSDLTQIIISI